MESSDADHRRIWVRELDAGLSESARSGSKSVLTLLELDARTSLRLKADAGSEGLQVENDRPHELRRFSMTDLLSATAAISKSAPWNKGKIARANAPPPQARLVNPNRAPGRRPDARSGAVQPCHRQQAARVRRRSIEGDDVVPSGYAAHTASVRQKKTGRRLKLELTE